MRRTLIIAPLALAACTVGPNYAGPPKVASPATFARAGQGADTAAPAVARWWETLGDPVLNTIETRALAANPDLAVAAARVRQARASLRSERAGQLPKVSAQADYLHAQLPGLDLGNGSGDAQGGSGGNSINSLDFFNLGFDASWEVDLFGGGRRDMEAQRAALAAAEANVADAQVSLTAEVAQAYVNWRDRQARIALSARSAATERQMLALAQQRFAGGTASELDVERLRGQVESTDAERLPLQAEADAYRDALAMLTGAAPGALDAELAPPVPAPLPPAEVAIGDPAALLQRRPDIRAAERQLAQQTARIGYAEAARFPRLSFMGLVGIGGTHPGDVVDPGNITALIAPQLSWSFLDFGRNAARVEQVRGQRDEAEAHYRSVVLGALRDAEDSLSRFGHRRDTVASLARVKASADRASLLMQQRYRAGTATLTDTLDAERQRLSAEQNLAQGTAALTGDFIAVQKSLGLGWQAAL
jgi:NodT family efflux transporter outer membrane factor (OMF) lipoprotein